MMKIIVLGVQVISAIHAFLGLVSVCVGVISNIRAEVWLAHSVSPIWSGGFFLITGILGVLCSKKKTAYLIMCFTAFSVVSLVTAVVSIQLLRLGLVNHTTDGQTFQKQHKDVLIIIALVAAGTECIVCLVSTVFSCRMAKAVKKELFKQREGMFHVKGGDGQSLGTSTSIVMDNLSTDEQQLDEDADSKLGELEADGQVERKATKHGKVEAPDSEDRDLENQQNNPEIGNGEQDVQVQNTLELKTSATKDTPDNEFGKLSLDQDTKSLKENNCLRLSQINPSLTGVHGPEPPYLFGD